MSLAKKMVKWLLAREGYEVRPTTHWGIDLIRDASRLVGGRDRAKVIVDVGANRGQAASLLLGAFPCATVHSYEPLPDAYRALTQLPSSRLRTANIALGSTEGRQVLNVSAADDGSSLLALSSKITPGQFGDWTRPVGQVEVSVRRLDRVLHESGIGVVDLLKIDTQGYDLEVLRGAGASLSPARIRTVIVELNFLHYYEGQASPGSVTDFLVERGYLPVGLYGGRRDQTGRIEWCDALLA